MGLSETGLATRARRSYELGRVRAGLSPTLLVLPMAVASLWGCDRPAASLACATALAVLVLGCVWYGRALSRAVVPGLRAGLPPLVLPLAFGAAQRFCAADLCLLFPAACVAGGIAGGLLLGLRGVRRGETSAAFWIAGGLIAVLAGSLGCLLGGVAGLLGLVLALPAGAAPVIAVRRA